jgi:hypothetical protein
LDPHPWAATGRSASSLGNPVFLGAWLAMAAIVTAERLLAARRAGLAGRPAVWGWSLVLVVELAGLAVSQSRGPFLGLLAGLFFAAILALGRSPSTTPASPWIRPLLPWTLGAAVVLLLGVIQIEHSPLAGVRAWPYLGRLSSVFDPSSRNALVRTAMWSGSLELLAHPRPAASDDPLPQRPGLVRRLFGYGPETQSLVAPHHLAPELARIEGWGKIPDRSHNELYDHLLESGAVGALAWLALFSTALSLAARRLGYLPHQRHRRAAALAGIGGAVAASLGAFLFGAPAFSAPAFSAGGLAGLALFLGRRSMLERRQAARLTAPVALTALLAGVVVAHFVEIQFGFGTTATRTLVAVLLGALVVLSATRSTGATSGSGLATKTSLLPLAVLTALATGTLVFDLIGNWGRLADPAAILLGLVAGTAQDRGLHSGGTTLVLVASPVLVGAFLACRSRERADSILLLAGVALLPPSLYTWAHASRLARTVLLERDGASPLALALHVGGHFETWHSYLILALLLLTACLVAQHRPEIAEPPTAAGPIVAIAAIAAAGLALLTGATTATRSAEVVLKHARARADAGAFAAAAPLFEHACEVLSYDDQCLLFQGRAGLEWAKRVPPEERTQRLEWARLALESAARKRPLDADHAVNLGRFHVIAAALARDPAARTKHWLEARRAYDRALALFPDSAPILQESAVPLLLLAEKQLSQERIDRARSLDPSLPPPGVPPNRW